MWEETDHLRRWQGKILDALGYGPLETPARVVLDEPGFILREYRDNPRTGPVVLIIPAPIKRAYIWDLAPNCSVVRRCIDSGFRVYLIQWQPPPENFGLEDYARRIIGECLDAIEAEAEQEHPFLLSHSLGGTLAAIYSALHPQRPGGLVLLASPLHFSLESRSGVLGPAIAKFVGGGGLKNRSGNIPGSLLAFLSFAASPETFGSGRWTDWLQSLTDSTAMSTHLRVERWALDELPLSRQLVNDIVQRLYQEDSLMRGRVVFNGLRAAPQDIAAPVLIVADRRCLVVPPAAILPFYQALSGQKNQLLWYGGDTGVAIQHVGMLVGKTAHQNLWPSITDWMHKVARSRQLPQNKESGVPAQNDRP